MADFETRVEALTGLTVGTNPTTAELTEYLKDGVIDVTQRCITLKPNEQDLFADVTGLQVAQSADLHGAKVISVLRADGVTACNFRPCRKISLTLEHLVTDPNSLHFASKFNPAFLQTEDGKINVYPAPSDNSGKDSYKIYYVNNNPQNASGLALTNSHSDIKSFPQDKIYLVILYAGIKSLANALAAKGVTIETALTPDDITLPVPPVAPSIDSTSIDTSGLTNPTFQAPVMNTPSWSDTENWISVEEDSEMLGARVTEINAKIQAYTADLQSAKTAFDKENTILQKDLSVAQGNAQSYERGILTKYSQQINQYQQEVGGLVQKYMAEVQKAGARLTQYRIDYEWMSSRMTLLQREYDTAFVVMAGRAPQLPQVQQQQQAATGGRAPRRGRRR